MDSDVREAATVADRLLALIDSHQARIGIIGLGYVGLPLAVRFANAGFSVLALDADATRVAKVSHGEDYIRSEDALLSDQVSHGRLSASTSFDGLGDCDAVVVCVPTPLTRHREPDTSHISAAAVQIASRLRQGQLIVLESTTYPGTTEEILLPILSGSGLTVGVDFHLAYSPERIDPGNKDYHTGNTPKIVGGVTPRCAAVAKALYEQSVPEVFLATSTRVAEMVKLLENIFRSVNIALVNEMALLSRRMNIDIWEVIRLAATKPYGFMPFYPGPGMGGHCIPIDPFYLTWKAREYEFQTHFIELAGEINVQMPERVVDLLIDALGTHRKSLRGSHVLVMGAAYKRDVADFRESPSLKIIELLEARGATVSYNDPHLPTIEVMTARLWSVALDDLTKYDCVLIATDHTAYDFARVVREARLVVDTRNATGARGMDHVFVL